MYHAKSNTDSPKGFIQKSILLPGPSFVGFEQTRCKQSQVKQEQTTEITMEKPLRQIEQVQKAQCLQTKTSRQTLYRQALPLLLEKYHHLPDWPLVQLSALH